MSTAGEMVEVDEGMERRAMINERAARVLRAIVDIRREKHACTARELSRMLRNSNTLTVRNLRTLWAHDLVDWSDVHGSVHVTGKGAQFMQTVEKGGTPKLDLSEPGSRNGAPARQQN